MIELTFADIMSEDVVTVSPYDSLNHAIGLMFSFNIGSIVVVDDEKKVEGILTERDVVRIIIPENLDLKNTQVRHVMSLGVVTVSPKDPITKDVVGGRRFRRLPVTVNGRLRGIVTETDILKGLRRMLEDVKKNS